MKLYFIRHAKTTGNSEHRYIGKTDEPLCQTGIEELLKRNYPDTDIVAASPMKRCVETAKIIYPKKEIKIYSGFRECDFGDFEGKNYSDLGSNAYYQKWIDSMGTLPFPNGEDHAGFVNRCCEEFLKSVSQLSEYKSIAYVVHGGTIMAVLERFSSEKRSFYDSQVKNCGGYSCEYKHGKIFVIEEFL